MTEYNDGTSYRQPLSLVDSEGYVEASPIKVGYEEETDSYGFVYYDENGEMQDTGVRATFEVYPNLTGRIEKNAKRVAVVRIITPEPLKLSVSGIYINYTRDGKAFCHWPSASFGTQNHLLGAFDGDRLSLVPLIVRMFFMWIETPQSKEFTDWRDAYCVTDNSSREG